MSPRDDYRSGDEAGARDWELRHTPSEDPRWAGEDWRGLDGMPADMHDLNECVCAMCAAIVMARALRAGADHEAVERLRAGMRSRRAAG